MEDPMEQLAVVSLPRFHKIKLGLGECLGPEYLLKQRGLDIQHLLSGTPFVDEMLGYAIVRKEEINDAQKMLTLGYDSRTSPVVYSDNWLAEVESDPESPRQQPENGIYPWFVDSVMGWPALTGEGVRVAVFDTGIKDIGRLRRIGDDSDFCSCIGEDKPTDDLDNHGTKCAGAIGASDLDGNRTSPAPSCQIIGVRVVRADEHNQITLVDMLLMLSWVIHRWNVQIVNMSFSLKRKQTQNRGAVELLGLVVEKLRRDNRALVFAAAVEKASGMSYPARVAGFVAVGTYTNESGTNRPMLASAEVWREKEDLLFGPCDSVPTVSSDGKPETFGSASAACAHVSGIAALYVKSHWADRPGNGKLDMEGVLALMKRRATSNEAVSAKSQDIWAIANLYPDASPVLR